VTLYDDAFKDLSEFDPEALLLLLGAISPDEHATIEPLSRELRAAKQIADQPYLIRSERGERIAHVEAQTRYKGNEPDRLLDYGLYIWLTYQREYPVESYLLILAPDGAPAEIPVTHTVTAGSLVLTINFHVIRLWELSAQVALDLGREELLPFIPLMSGGEKVLEEVAQRVTVLTEDHRRGGLAMSFLGLGTLRYDSHLLLSLIGREPMILELIKDTPGYHVLCDMARNDGLNEGREAQTIRMINLLATKRFPQLALSATLEPIQDVATLEQLLLELDQFDTAEGLQARIAELTAKKETPTQ
jgi:hypothetical protein